MDKKSNYCAINAIDLPPKVYSISDEKLFMEGLKLNQNKPSDENTKKIHAWFARVDKQCEKISEIPVRGITLLFEL